MIQFTPANPEGGETITLSLDDATWESWELLAVPSTSALALGRLLDNDGQYINTFVPDVAGLYEVLGYGSRQFIAPAQFLGDPTGEQRKMILAPQTANIYVSDTTDLFVTTKRFGQVTLRLTVRDLQILGATFLGASTSTLATAAQDQELLDYLAELLTYEVPDIGEEFVERANELREAYEKHRLNIGGVFHVPDADTVNVVSARYADSVDSALQLLSDVSAKLTRHAYTQPPLTLQWHYCDDSENRPETTVGGTMGEALVHLVDLCDRLYSRHIGLYGNIGVIPDQPYVHAIPDEVNVLSEPRPLSLVLAMLLDKAAKSLQWSPDDATPGIVMGRSMFGFR